MAKTVITYGTFDMFHIGHLNILKRAKALGDKLIVGVTSEDYDRSRGKLNVVQSLEERIQTIKELDFVDKVIVEKHKNQKQVDIKKHQVNEFVIGDDWLGKFDYLKEYCTVIYLPRTDGISSTLLRESIENVKVGIIGAGRIAKRFIEESKFVNNMEVHSIMSRNMKNVKIFLQDNNILYGFDKLNAFLDSDITAVYIASPHEFHYVQAKAALDAGKHVLCEKPATLDAEQLLELINIAKSKNLVFLEAMKTAFFPAFTKLIEELQNGAIGDIKEVRATFTKLVDDKNSREWQETYGGATNELASYPLLLAQKVLPQIKTTNFYDNIKNGLDSSNMIISTHKDGSFSIATVGIGLKSEGCAVISGTKGYVYIPAPWWLTKDFYFRFEDPNKEFSFHYNFEGDGLRYEISEFISLIKRGKIESTRLLFEDMIEINKVISSYNKYRTNKDSQ